jgi:hypothetical protein
MQPQIIPCSQTYCTGYADKPGGLCRECQKIADETRERNEANKWRFAGWDRHDERQQLQGKKGRK